MEQPQIDPIAQNAAGIMDAWRRAQSCDKDGDDRFRQALDDHHGFIGVVDQMVAAAREMERFRASRGSDSDWGVDLPHVYEAWDMIGAALCAALSGTNVVRLTRFALDALVACHEAASSEWDEAHEDAAGASQGATGVRSLSASKRAMSTRASGVAGRDVDHGAAVRLLPTVAGSKSSRRGRGRGQVHGRQKDS